MLKRKQNKKKKGFTLIELIVVLAVLAIIALIAIPNFNQIRENSKTKADQRSAAHIEKAVDMLIADEDVKTAATAVLVYQKSMTGTGLGAEATKIYESIKGTEDPQSKTGTGSSAVKNDAWQIDIVADNTTPGGLKCKVKAIKKTAA